MSITLSNNNPSIVTLFAHTPSLSFRFGEISQDKKSVPLPKSAIIILPMSISVKTVFCCVYTNSKMKSTYSITRQRYWKAT